MGRRRRFSDNARLASSLKRRPVLGRVKLLLRCSFASPAEEETLRSSSMDCKNAPLLWQSLTRPQPQHAQRRSASPLRGFHPQRTNSPLETQRLQNGTADARAVQTPGGAGSAAPADALACLGLGVEKVWQRDAVGAAIAESAAQLSAVPADARFLNSEVGVSANDGDGNGGGHRRSSESRGSVASFLDGILAPPPFSKNSPQQALLPRLAAPAPKKRTRQTSLEEGGFRDGKKRRPRKPTDADAAVHTADAGVEPSRAGLGAPSGRLLAFSSKSREVLDAPCSPTDPQGQQLPSREQRVKGEKVEADSPSGGSSDEDEEYLQISLCKRRHRQAQLQAAVGSSRASEAPGNFVFCAKKKGPYSACSEKFLQGQVSERAAYASGGEGLGRRRRSKSKKERRRRDSPLAVSSEHAPSAPLRSESPFEKAISAERQAPRPLASGRQDGDRRMHAAAAALRGSFRQREKASSQAKKGASGLAELAAKDFAAARLPSEAKTLPAAAAGRLAPQPKFGRALQLVPSVLKASPQAAARASAIAAAASAASTKGGLPSPSCEEAAAEAAKRAAGVLQAEAPSSVAAVAVSAAELGKLPFAAAAFWRAAAATSAARRPTVGALDVCVVHGKSCASKTKSSKRRSAPRVCLECQRVLAVFKCV